MPTGPTALDSEVIPSFLGVRENPTSRETYDGDVFANTMLRLGEVQAIIYPTDPRSRSNKFIEYSVLCEHRANGIKITKMYDGCLLVNSFGGLADFMMWTLRPPNGISTVVPNLPALASGLSTGSKVLILCVNGESFAPIILGGIRQFSDDDFSAIPGLHFLQGAFNGFKWLIDDLGQLTLTYTGSNDDKGFPRPPNPGPAITGTQLQFRVDGSFLVQDGQGLQSFTIDNTLKEIDIVAGQQFNVASSGTIGLTAGAGASLTASSVTVTATAGVSISGGPLGVTLGQGTDALIKGTTYRAAQTSLNNGLIAAFTQLTAAITAASTALGQGVSGLGQAATALAAAAAATTQMGAQLASFEAGSVGYLSIFSKTD